MKYGETLYVYVATGWFIEKLLGEWQNTVDPDQMPF